MPAKAKYRKCLCCPNKHFSRGLCRRCLSDASNRVERGETTEAQLIELGLMLPLQKQGRPRGGKSGFAKAFGKAS